MSIPVPLRTDFEAVALRRAAKATKDAAQGRRLLALAEVYDGGTSFIVIVSVEFFPAIELFLRFTLNGLGLILVLGRSHAASLPRAAAVGPQKSAEPANPRAHRFSSRNAVVAAREDDEED